MATVIARIERAQGEDDFAFKRRVTDEYNRLCDDLYALVSEDPAQWVLTRTHETDDGTLNIRHAFTWGLAFPEVPAATCCIAWLSRSEAKAPFALHGGQL